jgi:hypothetical protein
MGSNPKVFAALTTTGMVLSLILPASGIESHAAGIEAGTSTTHPLSHRVDRLKAKLRNIPPPASQGKIENIVQFFNFSNCSRGTWKNC